MYEIHLLVLLLIFGHIAWRDLRMGAFLIAAALPAYLLRLSVWIIPLTFLELLLLFFIALWYLKRGRAFRLTPDTRRWLPAIGVLLVASIVSVFTAPDLVSALGIWKAYFFEPILLFFVLHDVLREPTDREHMITALGIGGVFVAAFGVIQSVTGMGLPAPWDIEGRITSIFPYPNAVGLYLGPLIVLGSFALTQAWNAHKKFLTFLWGVGILLMLLAVVLAQSEAAWVALAATAVVAGILMKKTRIATLGLTVVAALIIIASPLREPVFEKLTLHDYSGEVRRSQWSETGDMLRDHWLLGAGLSGYPTVFAPYHTASHIEVFQYPHNIVLNTWVELGILGLIALAIFAYEIARRGAGLLHNSLSAPLALAAVLAILEMTIHGLVDVPYFKNDLAVMTWIILALLSLSTTRSYESR